MDPLYVTTAIPYVNAAAAPRPRARAGRDRRPRPPRPIRGPHRFASSPAPTTTRPRTSPRPRQQAYPSRPSSRRTRNASPRCANRLACRTTTSSRTSDRLAAPAGRRTALGALRRGRAISTGGTYEGRFCNGCEQFVEPDDLVDGVCPEHLRAPEAVAEENWFFRLSRYEEPLRAALTSGALRVEPEARRNEVLAFVDARAARLQRLPSTRALAGLGHPRARRSDADHLRLVRRARELHQRARLRHRRPPTSTRGGSRRRRAGARRRQGHPPLPRGLVARDAAVGRRAAPDGGLRARLPHGRRHQDLEVARQHRRSGRARRALRHRRAAMVAAARACRASATPTSPSPDSSTSRTATSPTGSAISCAGSRRLTHRLRGGVVPRMAPTRTRRRASRTSVGGSCRERIDRRAATGSTSVPRSTRSRRRSARRTDTSRPHSRGHATSDRRPRSMPCCRETVAARTCRRRPSSRRSFPTSRHAPSHALGDDGEPAARQRWRSSRASPKRDGQAIDIRKILGGEAEALGSGRTVGETGDELADSGANLKPWPEHGEQITIGPTRSTTKSSSASTCTGTSRPRTRRVRHRGSTRAA